jgi:hypothetical protein
MTRLIWTGLAMLTVATSHVTSQAPGSQAINLLDHLNAGRLRAVNRTITALQDGNRRGVRVSQATAVGVVWVEGTDFAEGTLEVDVRGRDVAQMSFVGLAFHRGTDNTYESVFLRPFNFRNTDVARRQNAVQYMVLPEFVWSRLRQDFPSEFENPVDGSLSPNDWVPLRVVVAGQRVQIFAGRGETPALDVRKLGSLDGGLIGLWVGNNSNGDFANLRIVPTSAR